MIGKFVYTAKIGDNTKFVYPSKTGQKANFVYKLYAISAVLNKGEEL